MADAITDDLSDFFADTLSAQAITTNAFGDTTNVGDPVSINCHISGKNRLVRNSSGQEVTSSYKVTCKGVNSLTTAGHRYTLPARFDPRTDIEAISVMQVADENGAHHEVVFLP